MEGFACACNLGCIGRSFRWTGLRYHSCAMTVLVLILYLSSHGKLDCHDVTHRHSVYGGVRPCVGGA